MAGRIFVDHYASTAVELVLPAVEDGVFDDNWRIRQSSVLLLGGFQLLPSHVPLPFRLSLMCHRLPPPFLVMCHCHSSCH